ncbi:hypothetical protein C8R45DRAFT_1218232 [Mycena sanguinolenta]|nr:hypothetical protein C8R45DRAFT_1218232 [Mycena sanguinolenta]
MAQINVETAFSRLQIADEDFFRPRRGHEHTRGSETTSFYVVTVGQVPGVYTHWEDVSRQVVGYPNCSFKKHRGWSAAMTAWDDASTQTSLKSAPRLYPQTCGACFGIIYLGAFDSDCSNKRLLYVYSQGDDTTIYADEQQASSAARRGLEDGSFRKVEVTPRVRNAFDHARESAEVIDISDLSDSE